MLIPAFQLQLGHPIQHGQVCVGKYDGKHPSLTCATSAGKVFLHVFENGDEAIWMSERSGWNHLERVTHSNMLPFCPQHRYPLSMRAEMFGVQLREEGWGGIERGPGSGGLPT